MALLQNSNICGSHHESMRLALLRSSEWHDADEVMLILPIDELRNNYLGRRSDLLVIDSDPSEEFLKLLLLIDI